MQTAGYLSISASDDRLAAAVRYGSGWQEQEDYYYAHGAAIRVATVPSVGLAQGRLIDGLNGNTLDFAYQPGATPSTIGKIFGPVSIRHSDPLSHLLLAEAEIDAGAATAALSGIDLANVPAGWDMTNMGNNLWASGQRLGPVPLAALYSAIGKVPGNAITPSNADNLLAYTTYGYDEWNRRASATRYAFYNAGTDPNNANQVLSKTTTGLAYQGWARAVTTTYPQGQQDIRTYNLQNGVQSAQVAVSGVITDLGSIVHDGLGRVVQYQDTLNGGTSTATYAPGTGLLTATTDAYGNQAAHTFDPTSFLLTETVLTPAAGGPPITVERSYDNRLQPTEITDNQGAVYGRSYDTDGSLAAVTTRYYGQTINDSGDDYGLGFDYDDYGDLVGIADAFLPPVGVTGRCGQSGESPAYYALNRDGHGRQISLALSAQPGNSGYYGVIRTLGYDAVTGLPSAETVANLPRQLDCDPSTTGDLSLVTALGYDQNLRPILKSVTRSDLSGAAAPLPAGVADLALTVSTATKAQTNQDLSYIITVKNKSPRLGGLPATGVTLRFVPAGAAAAGLSYTSIQQFQIWVAAANSVSAARPMVDALRLSTLRNRLRCRVDKARRSVSGTRHGGRARRIHQRSRGAAQIWNC